MLAASGQLAEARKLKFDNGQLNEGEAQSSKETTAEMRAKVERAQDEFLAVQDDDFQPTVVATEEPGDEPVERDAA